MSLPSSDKSCCAPARSGQVRDDINHDNTAAPQPNILSAEKTTLQAHDVKPIPGGAAFLGTDHPELLVDEEAPFRQVKVKPFWMDATAVTNARFAAFVSATGYVTDAERLGDSFVFAGFLPDHLALANTVVAAPWWRGIKGASWQRPLGDELPLELKDDHPVVHISWNDAVAFATWAGGRLPLEAEWEHAARGGQGDVAFPWGDDLPNDEDFFPCNIWQGKFPNKNTVKDGFDGTAPAKSFAPNGYGLYNMVGNTWEWMQQDFRVRSLKSSIKAAHRGKQGYKLMKGGSFLCHISYCFRYRIAARTANSPDSSTQHQGFRLVYDADPTLNDK